jgi:hypothetical protein
MALPCGTQVSLRPDGEGGVRLPAKLLSLYSALFDDLFQGLLDDEAESRPTGDDAAAPADQQQQQLQQHVQEVPVPGAPLDSVAGVCRCVLVCVPVSCARGVSRGCALACVVCGMDAGRVRVTTCARPHAMHARHAPWHTQVDDGPADHRGLLNDSTGEHVQVGSRHACVPAAPLVRRVQAHSPACLLFSTARECSPLTRTRAVTPNDTNHPTRQGG